MRLLVIRWKTGAVFTNGDQPSKPDNRICHVVANCRATYLRHLEPSARDVEALQVDVDIVE